VDPLDLSEEQREVQALTREFAQAEIAPHAAEWDREERVPREVIGQLAELGLLGICVPDEYGGAGHDYLSYVLALEELSRADAGVGVAVAVHTAAGTMPVVLHGTDAQRERYVPRLAAGEVIAAFALTEPEAGSDATAIRTRAEPVDGNGGGWSVSGRKQWITNGGFAGFFVLFARTASGPTAFCAEPGPGFEVTGEQRKMGLHSSSTVELAFDGYRLPDDALLGHEGRGMQIALSTLDGGRIGIAAQAIGIAQAAFDLAVEYAGTRHAFGGPIARFQAIQWKLADLSMRLDAARLLCYRAARLKSAGRPHTAEGAKAKLFASTLAREATSEAIQILGGYGYSKEFPAERYYRDAKVTELYEGTSEIQRLVIARSILGEAARG
jgi:alkylation response protein AidB-like acyl-CoA dehydrogenase